jgi:hypothetical protein
MGLIRLGLSIFLPIGYLLIYLLTHGPFRGYLVIYLPYRRARFTPILIILEVLWKKKILRGEMWNVKQKKLINSTV